MKKKFKMENLDCANCASKMEEAIKHIPGVQSASMNFMMQKLTLEIADGVNLDAIMEQAQACCTKVDAECKILI